MKPLQTFTHEERLTAIKRPVPNEQFVQNNPPPSQTKATTMFPGHVRYRGVRSIVLRERMASETIELAFVAPVELCTAYMQSVA